MLVPLHRRPPSWQRSFGRARRRFEAVLVHTDDDHVHDLEWLDGDTLACATDAGLVMLRR